MEARRMASSGQPGLHSETLSEKEKKSKEKNKYINQSINKKRLWGH
jgi:hypothetical protein